MSLIVVTGGAGFIGSNLVAGLEARGEHEIVICDRLGLDEKWRNIAKRELAEVVAPEDLLTYLRGSRRRIDAVLHMGAISSTTERDADLIARTTIALPIALWNWCTDNRVRLIYASSAATYGDGSQGFDDDGSIEGLAKLKPMNAYGWSKHVFDRRVARLVAEGGLTPPQWAGLKFFNVYGPNEYHKGAMRSVVNQIHPRAAAGEPARLFKSHHPDYADGGQSRDFIWVGDCVDVMLWLLDTPDVSGLFNLGTGKARSFADLAAATYRACGREPEIDYIDTPEEIREKYQYFTQARMERLRAAGYDAPFTELEDGIARYVNEHLSQADPYL
ncbi:MAG: ADP-glyceromanno-heptose 6-epimerase [Alphaproteobacteria bacterium]